MGGKLIRGDEEVRIFGEFKKVKAKIVVMPSMSAHGDQDEMMDFISLQKPNQLKKVFLIHGELDRQELFKVELNKKGFEVVIPKLGQEIELI